MNTFFKITLSITFLALLASCGSQPKKAEPAPAVKTEVKDTIQTSVEHPLWLDDPRLVNHIGVIGWADAKKIGGEDAQYWAAMAHAQTNLRLAFLEFQRQLLLSRQKTLKLSHESQLDLSTEELLFHNAIVKDDWRDPETNRLYLWLVLPEHHQQINDTEE